MKIFYKKDYLKSIKENKELNEKIENYKRTINKANSLLYNEEKRNSNLSREIIENENKITKLNSIISNLTDKVRIYTGKIGGLKKENNKLKKKLEESMTDKYVVRKLPKDKSNRRQVMKLKSCSKNSKIVKKMKNDIYN